MKKPEFDIKKSNEKIKREEALVYGNLKKRLKEKGFEKSKGLYVTGGLDPKKITLERKAQDSLPALELIIVHSPRGYDWAINSSSFKEVFHYHSGLIQEDQVVTEVEGYLQSIIKGKKYVGLRGK